MSATFLGGMGIAFQGARRGEQDVIDRENEAQNREYLANQQRFVEGQRRYQEGQQARTLDEQARADKIRDGIAAVPTTKQVDINPVPNDDEGNPMPPATKEVQRTQDEMLRDVAKAYQAAGDLGKYVDLSTAADGIAYKRAAADFNQLLPTVATTPLPDLARRVGAIFDADPTGGGVQSIQDIPNGVAVTLVNRSTGKTQTLQFVGDQGKRQLIEMAQAHYNPSQIQAAIEQARKERLEMIRRMGVTSVPDGYVDRAPDGTTTFTRTQAGGTGAGSGSSKPPKTREENAAEQLEFALTKGETKVQTPQQATAARRTMAQLLKENPTMPAEVGVDLAVKVATDPTAVKPGLNIETGVFDDMVKDEKSGGMFSVKRAVGTAAKLPQGLSPDDAKAQVEEALSIMESSAPGITAAYTTAAFTKGGRATLDAFMSDLARKSLEADPRYAKLTPDQQKAAVAAAVAQKADAVSSYVDLVSKFGKPPKAEKQSSSGAKRPQTLVEGMSTTDLKRVAAIDGHTSQQAAIDELNRRKQPKAAQPKAAQPAGLTPPGDTAASSLGFGF